MYDTGKVIVGLAVFLLLFTSPIWYNRLMGQEVKAPDLTPAKAMSRDGKCIKDVQFMRARHMDLLDDWRNEVVRDTDRFYKDEHGQERIWKDLAKAGDVQMDAKVQKSLSNTCVKCHSNYQEFCNACHASNSIVPYCWDCHLNFSEGVK